MLTGVVIAKNEFSNLGRCLKSLNFCDRLIVIDNGSDDNTTGLAKNLGARVYSTSVSGDFSALRNLALSKITSGWVLFLDADEIVSPLLRAEIIAGLSGTYNGYLIPRQDVLWGHQLRFGDTGGTRLLRLAKVNAGKWTGKVHEVWQVAGRVGTLSGSILHYPHPTLYEFLKEVNIYSSIRAQELFNNKKPSAVSDIIIYPVGKFLLNWIVKSGWRDGTVGFIHAAVMAFYSFMVRGKLYLLSKNPPHA